MSSKRLSPGRGYSGADNTVRRHGCSTRSLSIVSGIKALLLYDRVVQNPVKRGGNVETSLTRTLLSEFISVTWNLVLEISVWSIEDGDKFRRGEAIRLLIHPLFEGQNLE